MRLIIDEIIKIRKILSDKKIKYYTIYPRAGFADLMGHASVAATFCDLFELQFLGFSGQNASIHRTAYKDTRGFYEKFFNDLGFTQFVDFSNIGHIELYEDVDLLKIFENLYNRIQSLPQCEAICIEPKFLPTSPVVRFLFEIGLSLYNNSFVRFFQNALKKFGLYDHLCYDLNKTVYTIHLRIGDTAIVPINKKGDIVAIDWLCREEKTGKNHNSIYNLQRNKGGRHVINSYLDLENLFSFANKIRQRDKNCRINFISDGFDTAISFMSMSKIDQILQKRQIDFCQDIVSEYINNKKNILENNFCFDCSIIGENYDKFLESIKLLLTSNIIFSNARSFCYGILVNCKKDYFFKQEAYFRSQGDLYDIWLKEKNIELKKFAICNDNF
ncbi:hypothetical protein L8U40_02440 [Campylobacter lari]|nr:hypothetical protein [Campylobacter lari]